MARTEFAQPLPGSEGAGTITIEVAAKLLMVTPEWVRRLTKDGWIARTERGRLVHQTSHARSSTSWGRFTTRRGWSGKSVAPSN